MLSDSSELPNGEISLVERRRRLLEFFSDMMAQSMDDMYKYFQELEPYKTLSQSDQTVLFKASILEILILKVSWTIFYIFCTKNACAISYGAHMATGVLYKEKLQAKASMPCSDLHYGP